ncbi:hypothetical protein BV898_20005 [Hypsibius exemplaris]|uniref:Attractin/MKLN-like beta-propeller domain-containing protein n=1 Tax=Hypsibius exemplaris TaxID=2072580 RepID=A0A9X6NK30_HYPEX|nr:hypothetical protein BV898_20005 [Hypsibius exemplaris]
MAGHSAVYYKSLSSLVVFGGVRSASAGLHSIFLYNVREQIWTAITPQYAPNTLLAPFSQLAFHRADVIGNYMIISGGYNLQSDSRSCRRSGVYFFHLNCLAFLGSDVFEDKNLSTLTGCAVGSTNIQEKDK